MDNSTSITEFFYNIIPGSLFMLIAAKIINYSINPIHQKNAVFSVFIIISLGLLIGFILQGITKFDRKYPHKKFLFIKNLNDVAWEQTIKDGKSIELAKKHLKNMKITKENDSIQRIIYLMHNYLFAKQYDKRTDFYADRLAFWANIYYGILFIIVIFFGDKLYLVLANKLTIPLSISLDYLTAIGVLILVLFLWFSRWLYREYLINMHDVILKTFVMMAPKSPRQR